MSAYLAWTGTPLTMEQELVRIALALKDAHRSKRLTLDNFTPPTTEPYIGITQGTYDFSTQVEKDHLIITITMPIANDSAQYARKPWLNVVALGNEPINPAFGAP